VALGDCHHLNSPDRMYASPFSSHKVWYLRLSVSPAVLFSKINHQPPQHSFTNSQGFRFVISSHSCHRPVVLMSNYTSPSQCWMFPVAWIDCICDPLALLLSHWCWQRIVAVEISQHFVWVGNWYFFKKGEGWLLLNWWPSNYKSIVFLISKRTNTYLPQMPGKWDS